MHTKNQLNMRTPYEKNLGRDKERTTFAEDTQNQHHQRVRTVVDKLALDRPQFFAIFVRLRNREGAGTSRNRPAPRAVPLGSSAEELLEETRHFQIRSRPKTDPRHSGNTKTLTVHVTSSVFSLTPLWWCRRILTNVHLQSMVSTVPSIARTWSEQQTRSCVFRFVC